ncbi:MAG: DsbA family protein [Pseudomonadota bacterium]
MTKSWLLGAVCALALSPAAALDLGQMTEAEEQAFGEAVRQYLLDNPDVLMEAIAVLEEREALAQAEAEKVLITSSAAELFEDEGSYVGGNPEGDVTIVEFLDYKCGFCRRAHPEVTDLIETDGDIRIIVKELPILGEESLLASRFAISVLQTEGPDAYKTVNDTLLTMRGAITPASLERIATNAGLDAETILAGMDSDAVTDVIRRNQALAQKLAINGTPSFVFDDRLIRGYLPLGDMLTLVDTIRAEG